MSAFLLLVHSAEDVAHLESAANTLKTLGAKRVMVLHSPAIVIDQAQAAETLDKEIAELQSAEKAAADRGDYEAAGGYKRTREERTLDRAKTIGDAWKTMAPEAQRAAVTKIFTPFVQILNPDQKTGAAIRVTKHQDHYDRENWLTMVQAIAAGWPKEMAPGSFSVTWPGQLAGLNLSGKTAGQPATPVIPTVSVVEAPKPKKEVPPPANRREELMQMHHFSLYKIAREMGIETKGKIKNAIVEEVLAKEQPALV